MAINSNLMILGRVIEALAKKEKFIPFKDAILTQVLEKYLTGNGKLAMFVNISPLLSNLKETVSTLKYGNMAAEISNI